MVRGFPLCDYWDGYVAFQTSRLKLVQTHAHRLQGLCEGLQSVRAIVPVACPAAPWESAPEVQMAFSLSLAALGLFPSKLTMPCFYQSGKIGQDLLLLFFLEANPFVTHLSSTPQGLSGCRN